MLQVVESMYLSLRFITLSHLSGNWWIPPWKNVSLDKIQASGHWQRRTFRSVKLPPDNTRPYTASITKDVIIRLAAASLFTRHRSFELHLFRWNTFAISRRNTKIIIFPLIDTIHCILEQRKLSDTLLPISWLYAKVSKIFLYANTSTKFPFIRHCTCSVKQVTEITEVSQIEQKLLLILS